MVNIDIMLNLTASEATTMKEMVDLLIPSVRCLSQGI